MSMEDLQINRMREEWRMNEIRTVASETGQDATTLRTKRDADTSSSSSSSSSSSLTSGTSTPSGPIATYGNFPIISKFASTFGRSRATGSGETPINQGASSLQDRATACSRS